MVEHPTTGSSPPQTQVGAPISSRLKDCYEVIQMFCRQALLFPQFELPCRIKLARLFARLLRQGHGTRNAIAHGQQVLVGFLEGCGVDRVGRIGRKLFD